MADRIPGVSHICTDVEYTVLLLKYRDFFEKGVCVSRSLECMTDTSGGIAYIIPQCYN